MALDLTLATSITAASIILAAIILGLGRAFGYKRIEQFGIEELFQCIVNAAIIGGIVGITAAVTEISSGFGLSSCTGTVIEQFSCSMQTTNASLFSLFQSLLNLTSLLGYYGSLSLNFGSFNIMPFGNLTNMSNLFGIHMLVTNLLMIAISVNEQMAKFIAEQAFNGLLTIGLTFRAFFATRKIGGFVLALAIGLYIFYPSFVLIFPSPLTEINNATVNITAVTTNSYYAPLPVVDLNNNNALAEKIDVMSGRCSGAGAPNPTNCPTGTTNFTSDLTIAAQNTTSALAKTSLYAFVAPLFSLILTIIFVKELANLLGGEIGFRTLSNV